MNRSSTLDLVDKTPYEAWDGRRNIRVFGCDAFEHIPKERRQNLDTKLEKCIFVGYKYGVKGYKIWHLATKTIVYSRDVIFKEYGRTSETKEVREKKYEKLEFNWNKEIHDSDESTES